MHLIDRSPGAFFALANAIVYGVICSEIWMWAEATPAAVISVLAVVVMVGALIMRATLQLLADEDGEPVVAAATTVPARAHRPLLGSLGHAR